MASRREWSADEKDSLVQLLERANLQHDFTNMIQMGYIILDITKELTRVYGTPFIPQEGVNYDVSINQVWVSNKYNRRPQRETTKMRNFRENGEPKFKDLHAIFVVGKANVPDYDWLLKNISDDERICASLILEGNGAPVGFSGEKTSVGGGSGEGTSAGGGSVKVTFT
ncbi:hypothetical protein C2S52_007030 [Perilla frutescens var. hirtella]|nr:hypothetical protein C2S52_007030 [Perilla frutescens var. hirtella]